MSWYNTETRHSDADELADAIIEEVHNKNHTCIKALAQILINSCKGFTTSLDDLDDLDDLSFNVSTILRDAADDAVNTAYDYTLDETRKHLQQYFTEHPTSWSRTFLSLADSTRNKIYTNAYNKAHEHARPCFSYGKEHYDMMFFGMVIRIIAKTTKQHVKNDIERQLAVLRKV